MNWNPNYKLINKQRMKRTLIADNSDRDLLTAIYKDDPVKFINDYCITYDPRRDGDKKIPLILFDKQVELILWFKESIEIGQGGVILKARDMGATWCACAFTVWMWLYVDGSSVGWGSRKEMLVDRLGDPDSIFEKMRMIINRLPRRIAPKNYNSKLHSNFLKIVNPDNGSTITGEAGDNMGRGGRKTCYFKDESAHYDRAEKIEGALLDNTNIQFDISSVGAIGNVFHRKVQAPDTRIFQMPWDCHPLKDQVWFDIKEKKARDEGLIHIFRQEVCCDFTAAVEGILIPGDVVEACIDAHIKLNVEPEGIRQMGFDPCNGGRDSHAYVSRYGILINDCDEWSEGDTVEATRKVYQKCAQTSVSMLCYDGIGLGTQVKGEVNSIESRNTSDYDLELNSFIANAKVFRPEAVDYSDRKNKDMFSNLKAQQSWILRDKFHKTYRAVVKGEDIDPDDIISISSKMKSLNKLKTQISQPLRADNASGQIVIIKTPSATKSPNLFDALVQAFTGESYTLHEEDLWV